jgi:type IV pilus assembly protein PilA
MTNLNIKSKDRGFTIVELLVVIVVIGILAAISVVSYTGVTTNAKSKAALANANSVQSAAEGYNTDPSKTGFPTSITNLKAGSQYVKFPSSNLTIQSTAPTSASAETVIQYMIVNATESSNTGACFTYYDYVNSTTKTLYSGSATATTCTVTPGA